MEKKNFVSEQSQKRHERLKRGRFLASSGKKADFVKVEKKIYNNPFIIFAGVAILIFVATIIARYGAKDAGNSVGERSVFYGGKVYAEYDAPVVKDSLVLLGELSEDGKSADFSTVGFDLGFLYSIKGYGTDVWLAASYNGEYFMLKAKER